GLSYLILKCRIWNFGLKFAVMILAMELVLLFLLNCINYNFPYVIFPYPFEPFFFLPFLALISSQAILKLLNSHDFLARLKISKKNKQYISIVFLILLFSFGSLDAVLSASLWKTNNWTQLRPYPALNPWCPDYQLMNFLYICPSFAPYEYILTFTDRYNPESYVALPAGASIFTQPIIDILTHTNDPKEISFLTSTYFIRYILISREKPPLSESYLANATKGIDPIFSNIRYEVYLVSQLNLSETNSFPFFHEFLTAEKIFFNGALSLFDSLNGLIQLDNIKGEICSLEDGEIMITVEFPNGANTNITARTPFISVNGNLTMINMRATFNYFTEIRSSAELISIYGMSTFVIYNTFKKRIYMAYFIYSGVYSAFPIPNDFLVNYEITPFIKKPQIEYYLSINNANPLETLTSPLGIIWSILTIVAIMWMNVYRKKNQSPHRKLTSKNS
ncbi:MAG: hypothetical protein QXO71_10555, partial [Candidatus Jordarchaeaceae archaeon]